MAAGSLLILEAGGLVSNFNGEPGFLEDGRIVCGAPKIFPPLLKLCNRCIAAPPEPARRYPLAL